jgi:hypothetical protein
MVSLKHAPARPLKRAIPGTPYYIEISPVLLTVKVQGSRRPGVSLSLMEIIPHLSVPASAPAKFHAEPVAYLQWAARKIKKK